MGHGATVYATARILVHAVWGYSVPVFYMERHSTGFPSSQTKRTRPTCWAMSRATEPAQEWPCYVVASVSRPFSSSSSSSSFLPPSLPLYAKLTKCRADGYHSTHTDPKSIRNSRRCWIGLHPRNVLHLLHPHSRRNRNQETRRGSCQGCGSARGNFGITIHPASTDVLSSTSEVNPKKLSNCEKQISLIFWSIALHSGHSVSFSFSALISAFRI